MERQEIRDDAYRVWFDPRTTTVFFEGSLRLSTADYKPIAELLQQSVAGDPSYLTLNLSELTFLNSSGINTLYKFVISLRKRGSIKLTVLGSSSIGWQSKSLSNIKRFLPGATLTLQ